MRDMCLSVPCALLEIEIYNTKRKTYPRFKTSITGKATNKPQGNKERDMRVPPTYMRKHCLIAPLLKG